MTMQTIAETISDALNGDGQVWTTADGATIDDLIRQHGGHHRQSDNIHAYDFADGSTITIADGGWDIGYPDCYCWRGLGHERCTLDQSSIDQDWR